MKAARHRQPSVAIDAITGRDMRYAATLIGFWRAHKGRRAALDVLRPFVDRSRAVGGSDHCWDDPVLVGFLTTLITLIARRHAGRLDSDALGALQSQAWGALTGMSPHLLGEQIVALSVEADPRFAEGCRRAFIFDSALERSRDDGPDRLGPAQSRDLSAAAAGLLPQAPGEREAIFALWDRLLDRSGSDEL